MRHMQRRLWHPAPSTCRLQVWERVRICCVVVLWHSHQSDKACMPVCRRPQAPQPARRPPPQSSTSARPGEAAPRRAQGGLQVMWPQSDAGEPCGGRARSHESCSAWRRKPCGYQSWLRGGGGRLIGMHALSAWRFAPQSEHSHSTITLTCSHACTLQVAGAGCHRRRCMWPKRSLWSTQVRNMACSFLDCC